MSKQRQTPGLSRALFMYQLRQPRVWWAALCLVGVLALITLFSIRIPAQIDHQRATITDVTAVEGDEGTRPLYTARTPTAKVYRFGRATSGARSRLLEPGETVCLRIQTDRFTGRVSARISNRASDCGG